MTNDTVRVTTGDPRFEPDGLVMINGYRFVPWLAAEALQAIEDGEGDAQVIARQTLELIAVATLEKSRTNITAGEASSELCSLIATAETADQIRRGLTDILARTDPDDLAKAGIV